MTLREIAKVLQEYRLALPGDYLKQEISMWKTVQKQRMVSWYDFQHLKNQAYIGNMVQGKRRTSLYDNEARHATDEDDWIVVENTHEAIVDKELFNKVRALWIRRWKKAFSHLTGERICQ